MRRKMVCSSHTISGVMPGGPVPARHGFEARVAACAAAGYGGMCLHLRDYRALRQAGMANAQLAAILERHGMREISLEFLLDWFLDGDAGAQARDDEATAYAAAAAYGARSLNVGSDFRGRGFPRTMMRARFHELCERAGEHGLTVALEIVPWSDVRDVDTALDMVDGIDNAGLVVDAWHVFRGGIPLGDLGRIPGRKILCIQLNDADAQPAGPPALDTLRRRPCGEGSFDLAGFLGALERAGASAPVSVEIIAPDFAALDVETAAIRSHAGARDVLDRVLGLSAEGR